MYIGMYVCVSVYVCTYVCMYVHMYVGTYVCVCVCMDVCIILLNLNVYEMACLGRGLCSLNASSYVLFSINRFKNSFHGLV